MKKILVLSLLLLGPIAVFAVEPPTLECSSESLRFFPKAKVEQLIGPSQMIGMDKTACAYKSESGYFNGSAGKVDMIEAAFESFARANKGQVLSGRSCDRYSIMSESTGRGIIAQKDDYLIVIASSLEPQQNIDFAEYACAQVRSSSASVPTGSPMADNSIDDTKTGLSAFIVPLLIGLLGLVVLGSLLWYFVHRRGASAQPQVPTNTEPPASPGSESLPPTGTPPPVLPQ